MPKERLEPRSGIVNRIVVAFQAPRYTIIANPGWAGGTVMRQTILMIIAISGAIIFWDCLKQDAAADGVTVARHAKCGPDRPCVVPRRAACPDKYSCYSLYGAYGPWGGAAYWSRYSYGHTYGTWGYWR
jgi:hypothetical protein